jgi:hypothetical protein
MFETKQPMTKRMQLMLAVAAGLLVLNLWPSQPSIVAAVERNASEQAHPSVAMAPSALMASNSAPQTTERPMLEPARHDPFTPAPPVQVVVKALPPPPVPVVVPVVAAPSAPPLNLTFAGRITNPDGKQTIYVSFGETSMGIEKGTILPNGYRVESISEDAIELNFLALNTTARLPIPPAPRYEIR